MVPDQARTSLGLEYFLWDKDEEWQWPEDRLVELGIQECSQIGLIERDEVEDGTVVRMKKAYPVYDQLYQESLVKIRRYLETFDNLQTVGRNGLHRYNNQDHSMLTAVYAARNIAGAQHDVWAVNTEQEYHEEARTDSPKGQTISERGGDRLTPKILTTDELIQEAFARMSPVALGISVGTVSGLGLFLATVVLLLKGGNVVGPTLALLDNYLIGFSVTWPGAFIGLVETSAGGFMVGFLFASLRNLGMDAYAWVLERRAQRDLLEKV